MHKLLNAIRNFPFALFCTPLALSFFCSYLGMISSPLSEAQAEDTQPAAAVEAPEILPLDPWVVPTPEASASPVQSSSKSELSTEDPDDEPSPFVWKETGGNPTVSRRKDLLQDEFPTVLQHSARKRLERIEKQIKQRAGKVLRDRRKALLADPRGEPEFRLCSVNMNNFGNRKEVARLVSAQGLRGYKAKQNSLVTGIINSKCDLVAVQGVVGTNFAYAKSGLNEIASRITKRTSRQWDIYVAQSEKELGFNAFLVAPDRISYIESKTHSLLPLHRFASEEDQVFRRAPFEIQFRVKRKDAGPEELSRRFMVFSVHLQQSLTGNLHEKEAYRWQVADVVRKLIAQRIREERARDEFDPPAVIAAVELVSELESGVRFVIDGRRRVVDLQSGKCVLRSKEGLSSEAETEGAAPLEGDAASEEARGEEEVKKPEKGSKKKEPVFSVMYCAGAPIYEQFLFPLFFEPLPGPTVVKVAPPKNKKHKAAVTGEPSYKFVSPSKAEKQLHEKARNSSAQWFFTFDDLPLAGKTPTGALRYNAGTVELKTGLPRSPMIWVDLNW